MRISDWSSDVCSSDLEIWRAAPNGTRIANALVMAGGFGRRLGEKTKAQPKPLLKVGDKPILEHILAWLEQGGVRNIYISTHYLAQRNERSAERRVGKWGVSTCTDRGWWYTKKK